MGSKPIRSSCWRYSAHEAPAVPAHDTPAHERNGALEFSSDAIHFNEWNVPFREIIAAELTEVGAGIGILRVRARDEVLDFFVPAKRVPAEIGVTVERRTPAPVMRQALGRGRLIGAVIAATVLALVYMLTR